MDNCGQILLLLSWKFEEEILKYKTFS